MAASFDQYDKSSWYFGAMSRQDASDLLMGEKEGGVFLVRDSTSIHGDFVLCVREDSKVSHYIINKVQQGDQIRYRIGDQTFSDIPNLLAFYKLHYLDTTPLIRPAPKKIQRVIAKYDFEGNDPDDLPFRKGEILTVVTKDEEQWWTARNSVGQTGLVPVPYVQKYDEDNHGIENNVRSDSMSSGGSTASNSLGSSTNASVNVDTMQQVGTTPLIGSAVAAAAIATAAATTTTTITTATTATAVATGTGTATRRSNIQRTLPAFAKVKQARVPNAYDKTALKLEVGDMIKVTKMNMNGQWEGELHGRVGHFPFTHVEFVDNEPSEESNTQEV